MHRFNVYLAGGLVLWALWGVVLAWRAASDVNDAEERELSRLRWRCRRGMRELDQLFGALSRPRMAAGSRSASGEFSYVCWTARTISSGTGSWATSTAADAATRRTGRAHPHLAALSWRPSRWRGAAALVVLGALAALSIVASGMPLRLRWPSRLAGAPGHAASGWHAVNAPPQRWLVVAADAPRHAGRRRHRRARSCTGAARWPSCTGAIRTGRRQRLHLVARHPAPPAPS